MPEEFASEVNTLLSWLAWIAVGCCLLGLFFVVIRLAASMRSDGDVNLRDLAYVATACLLIGSASGIVMAVT